MHKQQKHSINPVAAAVGGAIVGAGVAVAATQMLKDEKTKDKVKQVMQKAQDKVTDMLDSSQDAANEHIDKLADKTKQQINTLSDKARDKLEGDDA